MEGADAVICLNCGYNTETQQRITTVRAYAHTPLDWSIWLAPGILCALAVLALIGLVCFLWIPAGLERVAGEAWWGHFSVQIYGSAVAAGVAWIAGKYAFRRLVQNPRPPEKIKKLSDQ
jgi:membrane protein implicated in regulation of membrane protease activity